jgi:hypothetical protein
MSATDLSTALQPAPKKTHSRLAARETPRTLQRIALVSAFARELELRWEVDSLDEVLDDHSSVSFAQYPATDAFSDGSIARGPAVTCSELGSERIRLVKIFPGPPGSTIECEAITCFLDQAPSYTAVSYTWGVFFGFSQNLHRRLSPYRTKEPLEVLASSQRTYPFEPLDWLALDRCLIHSSTGSL